MGISHSWNGTVLTITSDSGTSSADLKGDIGVRGPQGPAGTSASIKDLDLSNYYTRKEADEAISSAIGNIDFPETEVDLTAYATKDYVLEEVAKVSSSGEVDLTSYATKFYVDSAISGIELQKGDKGDKGADGYNPVRGIDYWTAEDIDEIKNYIDTAILGGLW